MEGLRESLGHLLRKVRSERNLTILELDEVTAAHGHRVPRSRLSLLERGEAPIRIDDLLALSRAYGFPMLDLCAEAVAMRSPEVFPGEWEAGQFFEEGKRLFDVGKLQIAGWAFDAAAEKAGSYDREFAGLARTSACHCYDRMGAKRLAMRRNEQALDILDGGCDAFKRAIGKRAVLLADFRAFGRARVYLDASLAALDGGVSPDLKAYLLDSSASTFHLLGELTSATEHSLRAARLYRRLGDYDWTALKLAAAATYLAEQGKVRQAQRHAHDAEGLLEEVTRVDTRVFVLTALGTVFVADGEPESARGHLEAAYRVAKKHDLTARAREAGEVLERLAEERGDGAERRRWKTRLARLSRANLEWSLLEPTCGKGRISDSGRMP